MNDVYLASGSVWKRPGWSDIAPVGVFNMLPSQPAVMAYADTLPSAFVAADWAHPGALVVCGRANYADQKIKDISAGGGSVLLYIDAINFASYGLFHDLLFNASQFGPAVPLWKNGSTTWPTNKSGTTQLYLADFRASSPMHQPSYTDSNLTKLEAVLAYCVALCPWIAGFFADDLGSMSYFSDLPWGSFGTQNQLDYRAGAILVAKAFRKICDLHGLVVVHNGTWNAGTVASAGGGYPDLNTIGCSIADGGVIEHHDYATQGPYFTAYANATQWGTESLVAGEQIIIIITVDSNLNSGGDLRSWKDANVASHIAAQSSADGYDGKAPWASNLWHANGLPSNVRY